MLRQPDTNQRCGKTNPPVPLAKKMVHKAKAPMGMFSVEVCICVEENDFPIVMPVVGLLGALERGFFAVAEI